jgi:DNA-binding CsgD family transcriptional regulator
MGNLKLADLQRFSQAALVLHATRNAEDFSGRLLNSLRGVLSGDIFVIDWNGADVPQRTVYAPLGAVSRDVNEAVHRNLRDNPSYGRRRVPTSISDVMNLAQWQRCALHGEAYGKVGQRDGLGVDIDLGRGRLLTLNVTRGRRGFDDTERELLGLLEPYVRLVHKRLRTQQRWAGTLDALDHDGRLDALSAREREVLRSVAEGGTNAEVATALHIRPGTVKRHLENIYAKLDVTGRAELAALRRITPRGAG